MRSALCIPAAFLVCGLRFLNADDTELAEVNAHRAKMRQVAESIRIADIESAMPAPLMSEPILRYSDATRATREAALWIWAGKGRPTAILATEFYPERAKGPSWLYEIASVSDRRISASSENGLDWSAEKPGLALQNLMNAGVPADQPLRRLSQMKQLFRRFQAYETAVIEGRIELRPLASALYRYEDPDSKLIDGAIFALANGTNPEVFVLLEAHAVTGGQNVWKYALAQMTGGEVTVVIDGSEVWKCEPADPPAARACYVNGWLPSGSKLEQ